MDRGLFIARGLAIKALQGAFVFTYLGMARTFALLDRHQPHRRH